MRGGDGFVVWLLRGKELKKQKLFTLYSIPWFYLKVFIFSIRMREFEESSSCWTGEGISGI